MRVALVTGRYAPGRDGVADYVTRLSGALGARGVEAVVVTGRDGTPGSRDGAVAAAGPPGWGGGGTADGATPAVLEVAVRWDLRGALRAAARLRHVDVDLLHVQFAPSAFGYRPGVGLLPLLRPGAPVVTTLHEYAWWSWPPRLPAAALAPLERLRLWDRETLALAPHSRRLVVTNPAHAAAVRRRLGAGPVVVPVGSNVEPVATGERAAAVRREERAARGLPDGAVVLAFFGFVHPVKGLRYLLDALAALRRGGRDVRLLVVGGFESLALPGEEARSFEREVRRHVTDLGLERVVDVTGFVPADVASRALLAADVCVLPFTAGVTGKSGSLWAALGHGLPVVATRPPDGGDDELVDGVTAVLVDAVRDAGALERGLRRVLDDAGLRRRVTTGGAALAAGRTWDRIADAHVALYEDALRG